ncbi:hypothetical protein [Salinigranum sp. GCM10025319]|uniref:hypothetical protein n=1 Tax=Salinigranum sp. GCM10025319 TaxID=3252687 RepID=UPI003616B8FE
MTLADSVGLSDAHERLAVRLLQLGLAGLAVYGLVTHQFGMAANGLFSLAVTLVPALLRREYGYTMDVGLVLWIAVAIVLHVVGSIGLYQQFSWYDEITHTVSATVVAGAGYAGFRAFEMHDSELDVPSTFRSVFIVVFVLAFGVAWEVFEFGAVEIARAMGFDSPVTVYGIDDIVTDFVFNAVGAVLVALWGTEYTSGVIGFLRGRLAAHGDE